MHLTRHLAQFPQKTGIVLTIGNFDGVHLGHQAVLAQLRQQGNKQQLPTAVLLFEPQPREFLTPQNAPARLSLLPEKLMLLQKAGIDHVICLRFDALFAQQSAQFFIEQVLCKHLKVRQIVVGHDFHFGRNAEGNVSILQKAGLQYGFDVIKAVTHAIQNRRVSSTWVRECLNKNDFDLAAQLLGRRYQLAGRVGHGQKLGRTLGFPTANILLHRRYAASSGIFAAHVLSNARPPMPAAVYLPKAPLNGQRWICAEAHLLNFSGDLYGQRLGLDFLTKIRDDQPFADLSALRLQIAQDVKEVTGFFNAPP